MSAISQTVDSYRQNLKELPGYYAALDAGRLPLERGLILSDEDRLRRQVIMRIMCDRRINYADLSRRLGVDFRPISPAKSSRWPISRPTVCCSAATRGS